MWRQARAVANCYGTTVNGTQVHVARGLLGERPVLAAARSLRVVHAAEHVGEPFRARDASFVLAGRNLHVWTKYTGIDPGSELLDRRRPDGFHHAPAADVLHVPAQPPLLTDEDDFT